jgi:hypothetical protein
MDARFRGHDKWYYILALETRPMMTFILTLFVMYWLPTIIAIVRHTPSAPGVAALNFFLGWTVIGWILALVWALAAGPQVIVIENGRVVRS